MKIDKINIQTLLSVNLEPCCITDKKWTILFINNEWENLFGFLSEDVIGTNFLDFFHSDEKDSLKEVKELNKYKNRFKCKGDFYKTIEWRFILEKDKRLISIKDITHKEQIEERFIQEYNYRKTLQEQSNDGIVIINQNGSVVEANKKFAEMLGYSLEEVKHLNVLDWEYLLAPNETIKLINEVDERGHRFETKHKRKDGTLYDVEIVTNAKWFGDDKLIFCICRDITERKNAEKAILEGKQRFEQIFYNNPIPTQIINNKGQSLFVNKAYKEFFGFEPDPDYSIFEDQTLAKNNITTPLKNLIDGNSVEFPEFEYFNEKGKQKSKYWIKLEAFPLQTTNTSTSEFILIFKDLTYQWLLKEMLRVRFLILEYSINNTIEKLLQKTLDEIEKLTHSEVSFYHILAEDQETIQLRAFSTNTISKYCNMKEKSEDSSSILHSNIWREIIQEKQPIIHNDYKNLKFSQNLPEGHTDIVRELIVPVIRNNKVVAIIGVGNKAFDYNENDLEILSNISNFTWEIVAQKKGEEELEKSRKKYFDFYNLMRLLVDNMPDMLWAKNLNREFIFVNKAICENLLNAKDTDEPIGKTDMYFANRERESHPENPKWHTFGEICVDSDSITIQNMKASQFDEFGNVKGKFLYLDVHKAPLLDENGNLIGVVGSARDVTKEKLAEAELKKLLQAVEQNPTSIIITDNEGKIEYVNKKFTEITGYSFDEVKGKSPKILKSGKHSAEFYSELWNTIKSGNQWKGEFNNRKKNGELFWESAIISPIFDNNGNITNYLAIKEDITVRKDLEAKLENEIKFRELLIEIASEFINIPLDRNNEAVNKSLEKLGKFVEADRAYTFDYYWDKNICRNTFEWCAPGIEPEIENLQNLSIDTMGDTSDFHKRGEPYYIYDVNNMPEGPGKEVLLSQNIKSLLLVPMMDGNKCLGFVGFDSVKNNRVYTEIELQLLKYFAQSLTNAKLRKEMFNEILEAKEEAEKNEIYYRTIFNQTPILFWEEDLSEIRNYLNEIKNKDIKDFKVYFDEHPNIVIECAKRMKIINVNDAVLKVLKYPDKETLIKNFDKTLTNVSVEVFKLALVNLAENKKYFECITEHVTSDGEVRQFLLKSFTPQEKSIDFNLVIVSMIDITDLKNKEKELIKAKEKAEESDRLKTAFLQNMNHEVRTPLNGIFGFTQLLKEEGITKEKINLYTDIIYQSGKRLMETIENILEISRIETGQIEVSNRLFSLNALIKEVHHIYSEYAKSKGLNFKYHCPLKDEDSFIESDPVKLNQILLNLISNAIKFTDKGEVVFGYSVKDKFIEFFVKDTGFGIPEESKSRIFVRFAQADLSLSRGYEGAGLGLAISKGLVEILGGRIWFMSQKNYGTTFYFTIPYKSKATAEKETKIKTQAVEKKIEGKEIKILVVEDDKINRDYFYNVLKNNYKVTLAATGMEAIEMCKKESFDVILMDIRLPDIDGFNVTKIIRETHPDVPIIAQSAYTTREETEKYLEIFNDYLTKPFTVSEINEKIYKAIQNK